MIETHPDPPADSRRALRFGKSIAYLGLFLFVGFSLYQLVMSFTGGEGVDLVYKEDYLLKPYPGEFSIPMRLLGIVLDLLRECTGIAALIVAIRLFRGYGRGEVFTLRSAKRLRLIGWLVVLMAPIEIVVVTIGTALFSNWVEAGDWPVSLSLEPGHIYAAVFGSLIAVVAQVMVRAIAIDEENRSII